MLPGLLPEVISDHIFPYLQPNDLLRLRRVSKVSRHMAETYLRLHGASTRVIYVDEDVLPSLLALPFTVPVTRIHVHYKDVSALGSEPMRLFLNRYGHRITHLDINCLEIPLVSGDVVHFFEGLPNLKELSVVYLRGPPNSRMEMDSDLASPDLHLPSTLQRLENLHVGHVNTFSSRQAVQFLLACLNECSSLAESIRHPLVACYCRGITLPGGEFDCVTNIVERRHRENPDQPNLKFYDLRGFYDKRIDPVIARSFYELVTTCSAHNVKLQNVDAELIEEMMKLDTPDKGLHGDKISRCVVSIKSLTPAVFRLELPLLEKIFILYISKCSMPEGDFEAQPWSKLRRLEVSVNDMQKDEEVSRLFYFLFHGIRRENLDSLDLKFVFNRIHPEMTNVCLSCPNLRKLGICKWPRDNRDIAQLWGNLPLLEDVTFEWCENLGDAAFIGDDVTRPVILKATRLKSLTLKRLDDMPGITDNLFECALRHMPLKALYLKGSWKLRRLQPWITISGLESLLSGKFAETIDKFPLVGRIEVEGGSEEQLTELEGKFRSSQMQLYHGGGRCSCMSCS